MNIKAIVIAELKKKEASAAADLDRIRAVIASFADNGVAGAEPKPKRHRRTKAEMQAAKGASLAKAAE
jgi:hypothetical protein